MLGEPGKASHQASGRPPRHSGLPSLEAIQHLKELVGAQILCQVAQRSGLNGLKQVGVPVFARGLTANSPQKNGPGTVGLEISIGGAVIRSGDLIVGDRDGVVVLPQDRIPRALEGLQAVREKERKIEALIAEGLQKPDWVKEYLAGERVQYID